MNQIRKNKKNSTLFDVDCDVHCDVGSTARVVQCDARALEGR